MADDFDSKAALEFLTSEMTAGFARLHSQLLGSEALLSLNLEETRRLGIVQGALQLGVEAVGQRLDGITQRFSSMDGRLDSLDRRLGHLTRKWMESGTASLGQVTVAIEEGRELRMIVDKLEERCKGLEQIVARLEAERDAG